MIRYTEEKKAKAVADANRTSPKLAAKKNGVSEMSVRTWMKAAKSNGSAVSGAGPLGTCSSLGDPPPEPAPMDEAFKSRPMAQRTAEYVADTMMEELRVVRRELLQTQAMLSLRDQEIAILRERLGEANL